MKEMFVDKKFRADSLAIIDKANEIIEDYQNQGFTLTLRQLYYQFVRRVIIPNKQSEYKRLGAIINDARMAGLIDWSAIEDRTRNLESPNAWDSPASVLEATADQYQEDLWKDQPNRVEVWIEKEALIGVVEGVCEELRIPYFACRGYCSQSESYSAGKRLRRYIRSRQAPIILHLGDHDPSGIDMTRDNDERLNMFAGGYVELRRIALNMDQITLYNPPPNPAKDTDSRFEDYRMKHGDDSWELDALDPATIVQLIRDEVDTIRDDAKWDTSKDAEQEERDHIVKIANNWDDIVAYAEANL